MARGRSLIGWLVMQKEDMTGRVIIAVYEQANTIYLVRNDSALQGVNAGRAMRWSDEPVGFWSCTATMTWNDLEIHEETFYPLALGYPS